MGKLSDVRDIPNDWRYSIERPQRYLQGYYGPDRPWAEGRYEDIPWAEVESVGYSTFDRGQKKGGWIMHPCMVYSDYSGSTCERSNVEWFREEFADCHRGPDGNPNWINVYGGYGTDSIAIAISWLLSGDDRAIEAWEVLCGLTDYPLADESHHSELEIRLQDESWESNACDDLRRACRKECEGIDREDLADAFDDDSLAPIWPHVLGANLSSMPSGPNSIPGVFSNAYESDPPRCENAVNAYWPVDDYAGACSEEDLETLVSEARAMHATWIEKGAYACLECRVTSGQERLFSHGARECHHPSCTSYGSERAA